MDWEVLRDSIEHIEHELRNATIENIESPEFLAVIRRLRRMAVMGRELRTIIDSL